MGNDRSFVAKKVAKSSKSIINDYCVKQLSAAKGVYREEGMQLTMYRTYSSNFVSETGYAKNRIQYTDVNKWAVLFTEI